MWPFLAMIVMLVFAAREEVNALPELYADAVERGDTDAVRELSRLMHLGEVGPVRIAEMLVRRDRFSDARALLSSSARDARGDALLAYATARAGDPDEAVEIARDALVRISVTDDRNADLEGALGMALALAGRHDEAIAVLAAAGAASDEGAADAADGTSFAEEARAVLAERTPFRG